MERFEDKGLKTKGKNTYCAVFIGSYCQALTLRFYPVKFLYNAFYSQSRAISSRTDDELLQALIF